jgi:hypothetical protein
MKIISDQITDKMLELLEQQLISPINSYAVG